MKEKSVLSLATGSWCRNSNSELTLCEGIVAVTITAKVIIGIMNSRLLAERRTMKPFNRFFAEINITYVLSKTILFVQYELHNLGRVSRNWYCKRGFAEMGIPLRSSFASK